MHERWEAVRYVLGTKLYYAFVSCINISNILFYLKETDAKFDKAKLWF